jgi:hypothetical protein
VFITLKSVLQIFCPIKTTISAPAEKLQRLWLRVVSKKCRGNDGDFTNYGVKKTIETNKNTIWGRETI